VRELATESGGGSDAGPPVAAERTLAKISIPNSIALGFESAFFDMGCLRGFCEE